MHFIKFEKWTHFFYINYARYIKYWLIDGSPLSTNMHHRINWHYMVNRKVFYKHARYRSAWNNENPFFENSRLTRDEHSLCSHSMNAKLPAEQCALIIKTGSSQFPLWLDKHLFVGWTICWIISRTRTKVYETTQCIINRRILLFEGVQLSFTIYSSRGEYPMR